MALLPQVVVVSADQSRGSVRLLRFIRSCRAARRHKIPLRWNWKPLWIQSKANWMDDVTSDVTDQEWEDFLRASELSDL